MRSQDKPCSKDFLGLDPRRPKNGTIWPLKLKTIVANYITEPAKTALAWELEGQMQLVINSLLDSVQNLIETD